MSVVWKGFVGSLAAGVMTGIGALGVFLLKGLWARFEDSLLSFAAGAMLFIISDEIVPRLIVGALKAWPPSVC